MPFDPSLPANNAVLDAAIVRAQLNALNLDKIDASQLAGAINGTSNNSNAVAILNQAATSAYDSSQMQSVLDKLDELINALRR